MFRNVFFFRRKQQFHASFVHAVCDVFRGEHVRCGDKYDAHFAARHDKYPVFPTTVEHTHYEVAFFTPYDEMTLHIFSDNSFISPKVMTFSSPF